MIYEDMDNEELVEEHQRAVENLPGSGARGRAWLAEVQEELLKRLDASNPLD